MPKQYLRYFANQTKRFQYISAGLVILVVAGLGTFLLTGSHAATPYASITADSGTLANGAFKQSCSGASNGNCVVFEGNGAKQANCFASPGKCGYPDPNYAWNSISAWVSGGGGVGPNNGTTPVACSSLPSGGYQTITTPGTTVQNQTLTGLVINASNVTVKNVCVTVNGNATLGSNAIFIESGSNVLIEDSTIAGANTSDQSIEIGTLNYGGNNVTLSHDNIYNCGECVHSGPWTIKDSYIITNGMVNTDDHYEVVYCDAGPGYTGTISATHDTMLNPEPQTAVIFCNTDNGSGGTCSNQLSVTGSLLAGGGAMFYPCANASSSGGTATITNNRLARCTTPPIGQFGLPANGGYTCQGDTIYTNGSDGADSHGYFPRGGYFEILTAGANNQTWCSNSWDDNLAYVNADGSTGATCP